MTEQTAVTENDIAPETNQKLFSRKLIVQLGVLLALTFVAVIVGSSFNQQLDNMMPEQEIFPSVFNHKPSGTSGVMDLLQRLGLSSQEWVLPYRELPTVHGALVVILPSESPEEYELQQILDWVAQGNQLIYLDDFAFDTGARLPRKLGIRIAMTPQTGDQTVGVPNSSAPLFSHVKQLVVAASAYLPQAPSLVSDKLGRALFTEVKHGKGRVLIGTPIGFVSNRYLSNKDSWQNFQFFFNWLSSTKGTVWFDERCHGFSRNANIFMYLLRGPAGLVMAQLLLILGIGVASGAQRFGRVETVNTKRKISNLEFIDGLANTYSRAHANAASLEIMVTAFKTKLCKALSVSPHEPPQHLFDALQNNTLLGDTLKQSVEAFLRRYDTALSAPTVPDNEFKLLMVRCDKITQQLNQALAQPTQTH